MDLDLERRSVRLREAQWDFNHIRGARRRDRTFEGNSCWIGQRELSPTCGVGRRVVSQEEPLICREEHGIHWQQTRHPVIDCTTGSDFSSSPSQADSQGHRTRCGMRHHLGADGCLIPSRIDQQLRRFATTIKGHGRWTGQPGCNRTQKPDRRIRRQRSDD